MPTASPCETFSLEELGELQISFHGLRSDQLLAEVAGSLRTPRHNSLATLNQELAADNAYARAHPAATEAFRDGRCAELAMQWVHHLSDAGRKMLAAGRVRLPLLAEKGTVEHSPELIRGGHHVVAKRLASQVTCQVGHDAVAEARGTWEGFPTWPYEVEYDAAGFGPYPFWTFNSAGTGSLTQGTPIHTYWSAVLNAERLEHANCQLKEMGWSEDQACTHLFLGTKYAYLFDAAESKCCVSSTPSYKCHLTTMPRDFYNIFNYDGIVDYEGESGFHSGQVKKYSMHLTTPSNFWFWYATDLDDKPVEQGEGGCAMFGPSGTRACPNGPKFLFHQYNTSSFKEVTLDPEVFAIPEVCKNTQEMCEVQPTRFCGDPSSVAV